MNNVLSPGVISAFVSLLAFAAGISGQDAIADWLGRPETVQNICLLVGTLSALAAGAMRGVNHPSTPGNTQAPPTTSYPGWRWDPVQGWVPDTEGTIGKQ